MAIKFICLFTCIFLFLSCKETLPPRHEPARLFEGLIRSEHKRIPLGTNKLPKWPLKISVGVRNIFDETLENTQHIKVTLRLWVKIRSSVKKTLIYEMSRPDKMITIDPWEIYWVELDWDHRDSKGNLVWNMLGAPPITEAGYEIEIKAVGTIQIFANLPAIPTEEVEFPIVYYLDPK